MGENSGNKGGRFLEGWRPFVILILLGCLFYLPGITRLPPTDRDEARFAQASRQMLETGNYVDIRFQSKPRYKKPIGIYWLQAASARLFGGENRSEIWPYRLPSFLGALIAILLTFSLGKRLFTPQAGFLAALLLESCVILQVEATIATTDAALLATIVAMMTLLGRLTLSEHHQSKWIAWGFWFFFGLGVLIKGPVPLLVAALTVIILTVKGKNFDLIKRLRPLSGGTVFLIVVLPWFWAIHKATGGTFVRKAFTEDLLPKLLGGHESHGAPPGLYLVLMPILFWPGILILIESVKTGWRQRHNRKIFFLLAWIVPTWLAFELIPTKLPHYILPVFPPLALLGGTYLDQVSFKSPHIPERQGLPVGRISKGLFLAVTLGICLGSVILQIYLNHAISPAGGVVLIATGILVWLVLNRRHLPAARTMGLICLIGGSLLTMPIFSFILPSANTLWISREVARAVRETRGSSEKFILGSVGYHEPSLVFFLGTQTRIDDVNEAINDMKNGTLTNLLIPIKMRRIFISEARKYHIKLIPIKRIRGFNYSKGKWLSLELFAVSHS